MKALCWHGKGDVRVDEVPDPQLKDSRDVILKVTSCAICGSDLHLLNGFVPTMESGDILGHEFMGEVVEAGANSNLQIGDRVVVPFTISCGSCFFCKKGLFSLCDTSNPNAEMARKKMGQSPAGIFGYSHMLGGFPGGQAEYVRVPFADVGPIKIESDLTDDQVLFLSDIFPTGYMAAENCDIEKGDTVAVWGCGPVGQFAIQSAWMLGAGRVIAIDEVTERLVMAEVKGKAETINFKMDNVYETLMEMTQGRGPDRCIDAVGTESHAGVGVEKVMDQVKVSLHMESDRPYVLRETIQCCRKGGTISIPGVYVGYVDHIPFGAIMNKGLTIRTGQTHVQRYLKQLLKEVEDKKIDPSFVITHKLALKDAPQGYLMFDKKENGCIKVVMQPNLSA